MKALLIDDHALFRAGLSGLLERRGIEVVASVGSGEEGIGTLETLSPDIILLDLRMPEKSGLDVLDALPTEQSDVPVVILTTSADENDLANALRRGARGYLMKDMEPDDLVVALQEIKAGKTVVAPGLTGVLADLVKNVSLDIWKSQMARSSCTLRRYCENWKCIHALRPLLWLSNMVSGAGLTGSRTDGDLLRL